MFTFVWNRYRWNVLPWDGKGGAEIPEQRPPHRTFIIKRPDPKPVLRRIRGTFNASTESAMMKMEGTVEALPIPTFIPKKGLSLIEMIIFLEVA